MGRNERDDITRKKLNCQISATVLMEVFEVLGNLCLKRDWWMCALGLWPYLRRLSVKVEGLLSQQGDVVVQKKELKRWRSIALNATGN